MKIDFIHFKILLVLNFSHITILHFTFTMFFPASPSCFYHFIQSNKNVIGEFIESIVVFNCKIDIIGNNGSYSKILI